MLEVLPPVRMKEVLLRVWTWDMPVCWLLAMLMLPALVYRVQIMSAPWSYVFDLSLFLGATASVGSFIAYARRQVDPNWRERFFHIPLVMALGLGIMLNQTKGVIEALRGQESKFFVCCRQEQKEFVICNFPCHS